MGPIIRKAIRQTLAGINSKDLITYGTINQLLWKLKLHMKHNEMRADSCGERRLPAMDTPIYLQQSLRTAVATSFEASLAMLGILSSFSQERKEI